MPLAATAPYPQPASAPHLADDAQAWREFSRPVAEQDGCWESAVRVEGMFCAACALTVEAAWRAVPGVLDAQVNSASHLARVRWDARATQPSHWMDALARAGYHAVPLYDAAQNLERRRASRLALWRWLVAGLCMMQVMMYAAPAYMAAPGDIGAQAASLLRWAAWVLTLPVLLFSCGPFFASALRDLRQRRIGMDVPVALGIAIAFLASTAVTFDTHAGPEREVWFDSLTMFVFFLLSGRMLEQRLRDRTAGALDALMQRLPRSVLRRGADGVFTRVSVRCLAPEDLIRVLPGEAFPADGCIVDGNTQVDEALLTGESRPLARGPGAWVIAGSHNLTASVEVRVERMGDATRYAGIVALMQQAALDKPQLAQLADRIARPFLLLVLLASAGAAAWWWPTDPSHAITVAIAVLIVTCPCALSLATPVATLAAAGALARRGILVRRMQVFETLEGIDTVVFDKTGTLTQDHMVLQAVHTRHGMDHAAALRLAGSLARHSLHPVSRALVQAAGDDLLPASDVAEIPGSGLRGMVTDGQAPEPRALRLGSRAFCGASAPMPPEDMLQTHLADDSGWLASFDFDEQLRPDAPHAIAALQQRGMQLQLWSGDQALPVARLAQRAGIARAHGECPPEGKLHHMRVLQAQGHRVAMVGDGLNDAPVLALANVSIAMGHAAPVAQSRADVVVPGSQLAALPLLWQQAARTRRVVRQNLAWAAAYNGLCVPLAVLGLMPPWLAGLGMATSSLLVILNAARLARLPADAGPQPWLAPGAPRGCEKTWAGPELTHEGQV